LVKALKINPRDNIAVVLGDVRTGESFPYSAGAVPPSGTLSPVATHLIQN
jgi:hypothetical protein